MASRWLYKYQGGGAFAWTDNDKDFYRSGGGYWAYRSGDWLYAAAGGSALGWFDGNTFYDQGTGQAKYYFG